MIVPVPVHCLSLIFIMKTVSELEPGVAQLYCFYYYPDCPALLVTNAMVNPCTGTIPHGSSATVACVPGFTIVGNLTMTCLEGKYDSTPSCKADCPTLTIPNAVNRPATQVGNGTTVKVVCSGINTLVGESMFTCYDGSYEDIPSCVFDISTVMAVSKRGRLSTGRATACSRQCK